MRKLPAGHLLRLEKGKVTISQYWDVPVQEVQASESEYEERLRALLADAVKLRLISDVPLGAFLSGGIDSSIIVGLMAGHTNSPVKTFSIGFDDPSYNELAYAQTVAQYFRTEHHELTIRPDIVDLSERLIRHFDEPFADSSMFSTFLVSQVTREHVTVALSGDGGDELFAGYDHYLAGKIDQWYGRLPPVLRCNIFPELVRRLPPSTRKKGVVNKLKRFVEGAAGPDELGHLRWITFLTAAEREQLYTGALHEQIMALDPVQYVTRHFARARGTDSLSQQMYVDLKTYLADDILVKVDRMFMANSLEARTPFLDYRVVELAAGMPSSLKLRGWERKYVLKQAMSSLLPPEVVNRKKEGFSVPLKNWLRGPLREMLQDVLNADTLKRQGWFQPQYVQRLMQEHLIGQANHGHQLWALMVLELWDRQYQQPYAMVNASSTVPWAAA
jgi:asparagine synthase (glutamine-hydrolysing)